MKRNGIKVIAILVALMLLLAGCGQPQTENPPAAGGEQKPVDSKPVFLSFASGPSSGLFGKAAAGISVVLKDKSDGRIQSTAQASAGAGENITLVNSSEAPMGVVDATSLHEAYYGEGAWTNKADNVRLVGSVAVQVMNLTTLEKSSIKTLADLKGKKVSLGNPGSAIEAFTKHYVEHMRLDVNKVFLQGGDAATSLKDGHIDAYFWGPGAVDPNLIDLATTTPVRILDIGTAAKEAGFFEKYIYFQPYTVKAGTYNGVDYDVQTLVTKTYWIVNKDLDDDLVYEMTKLAYTNTEALVGSYAPLSNMVPEAETLVGIDVPLHPGAEKFWKEIGVEIPDALKAVK